MAGIGGDTVIEGESIKELENLDPSVQKLIDAAVQVRKNAYCPYSDFAVGAALRTTDGRVFTGCNIESVSYTPTICAERAAIAKAVSEGYKTFTACAVVAHQENTFVSPCGVCRQVLSEFAEKDFPIYLAKPSPFHVLCTSVYKLLPHRFTG